MTDIDRSSCSAAQHGDENAYRHHHCACPDAREDRNVKKRQRVAAARAKENPRPTGPDHATTNGTTRRLQALAAIGWSDSDIANRVGLTDDWDAAVGRLYEELQGTPGPSPDSREHALRSGWAPPLLWEDDTIDDPDGRPIKDDPPPPRQRPEIDLDDLARSRAAGITREEWADRMGVALGSIERAEQRARQRANTSNIIARAREAVQEALDDQPVGWDDSAWQDWSDTSVAAHGESNARGAA